jgi:hypothetical protein
MNPFVTPCKKHGEKFHLDCEKCIELIKSALFEKEGKWNNVMVFDEAVDFMKKKGLVAV